MLRSVARHTGARPWFQFEAPTAAVALIQAEPSKHKTQAETNFIRQPQGHHTTAEAKPFTVGQGHHFQEQAGRPDSGRLLRDVKSNEFGLHLISLAGSEVLGLFGGPASRAMV